MSADFYGLPTRALDNGLLRLEYLAQAGPRIVRLFAAGSQDNLLAELPAFSMDTPYGPYFIRGGHRLWHSPEAFPRSYLPDNEGLAVEKVGDGVRLTQPVEPASGIRKSIELRLAAGQAVVTLTHEIKNEGVWPIELAPWAITQLRLGGVAILPQQIGALDAAGLLPNRQVVLWPYTRWSDPRLQPGDDLVLIQAQSVLPPCKIGYLNRHGWSAYLIGSTLFVKRFAADVNRAYPDFGCNAEVYCCDQFIEIESIGPLVTLEPGASTRHIETWELHQIGGDTSTPGGLRAALHNLKLMS
jgi:hypothetical protein